MVKFVSIDNIRVNMHTFKLISKYPNIKPKFIENNGLHVKTTIMVNNDVPDGWADIYGSNGEYIDRIKLK